LPTIARIERKSSTGLLVLLRVAFLAVSDQQWTDFRFEKLDVGLCAGRVRLLSARKLTQCKATQCKATQCKATQC
jgi:hypothetical protein